MAELIEYVLIWAIVVTIVLLTVGIFVFKLRRKHNADMEALGLVLKKKQTKSFTLGQSGVRGELTEILAGFSLLNEYRQLAVLSSVSKQFSLDLLGIKEDSVDFIEVKTIGTPLTTSENKVKKLIDQKMVQYRIIEGDFPDYKIQDRE